MSDIATFIDNLVPNHSTNDVVGIIDKLKFDVQFSQPQSEAIEFLTTFLLAHDDYAGVCVTDESGQILYVNERFCLTRGFTKHELIGTHHRFLTTALQQQEPEHIRMLELLGGGQPWSGVISNINKAGEQYWVNARIMPIRLNSGFRGYVAFSTNLTDHMALQEKLQSRLDSANNRLNTILSYAGKDWYWETDTQYKFKALDSNGHIDHERLLGKTMWEVANSRISDSIDWDGHKEILARKQEFFDFEQPISIGIKDGRFWVSMSGGPKFDKEGKFIGYHGIAKDVTERREKEDQFWALTHLDQLTGLPNKNHFKTKLDRRMISPSTSNDPFALVILELEDFQRINVTYGNSAGDMHLQIIAQRIRTSLREEDIVGRLVGAQFGIILVGATNKDDARKRVEELIKCLDNPYEVTDQGVCKIKCGISIYITDAHTPDHLIRTAEAALLHTTNAGQRYSFFEPEMLNKVQRYQTLSQDVHHSIDAGQLNLRYQPIVDLHTGKVSSFEALMFCVHPTKGLITAAQMIETLEDPTIAAKIGKVVAEKAIAQAAAWKRDKVPFGRVSINVTTADFTDGEVVERIKSLLMHHRVRPQEIVIEVTEGIFLGKEAHQVLKGLHDLNDHGVELAFDDFGTGYAHFKDLKLPISWIKIDKSFVNDIESDAHHHSVVKAVMEMARTLKKEVTVEGVETLKQLSVLQSLGCKYIQGYLFSKPIAPEEVAPFLLRFDAHRVLAELRAGDAS